MKKMLFIIVLLIVTMFTACTQQDDLQMSSSKDSGRITRVFVKNGQILKDTRSAGNEDCVGTMRFENEECFSNYRNSLMEMPDSIKSQYPQELGVTVLSEIEQKADHELDSIGAVSSTESEFRSLYMQFTNKYSNSLITNYIDNTDLSLYAPVSEDEDLKFIANENGEYVIGNRIYKISDRMLPYSIQLLSVITEGRTLKKGGSQISFAYKPIKGKRIKFCIERKKNKVYVYMSAHKHMWYGWKSDPNRWMVFEPVLTNFIPCPHRPTDNIYWYHRNTSIKEFIGNGILLTPPMLHDPEVKGKVYIWSDYELEKDAMGNVKKNYSGTPITEREKAKEIDVKLSGEH